eukprot:3680528-Pleurochrysis_carterae.AAC.1
MRWQVNGAFQKSDWEKHSVRRSYCAGGVEGGALQAVATAALRKRRRQQHAAASDDGGAARA